MRHTAPRGRITLLTGLVIAACAPRPEPEAEAENPPEDVASPPTREGTVTESEISPGVRLRLEVGPAGLLADSPIEFTLTVINDSAEELVLDFPDGQRFDFEVSRDGGSVWRWADDMFFPQMLGRERIPAGGRTPWSVTREPGLSAGRYGVRATLTTNTPATVGLEFDVAEGESAP
ncbi:MAG: BsuPI-related putative proteinase inhibitor [Gemmatimonadota bacterium]